ncbi:hypothetical protein BCR34DRAFT_587510 [Clohesyomyces aquaticus]|uniref:VOC domain-containing protein n=1 Tax=Clohesyomyces aquaticus TaxID=1231657 RepID=A0A1Y1ZQB5_9PLEO|nr:hypothetical protein BCR34DRAFT_587510 [Clohesyomyces aquaticus]
MPVSHIGLTVSHLPTSCSFFLSALQPLGYRFIGQQGNQIGLGIHDADFFLCQETPGVKAGAAHIAFTAPDRTAVRDFYTAALTAGGRPNGAPSTRNEDTGCFNAAVLDMDGNSIEVVFRNEPDVRDDGTVVEHSRVITWQRSVTESIRDDRSVVSARTVQSANRQALIPATANALSSAHSVISKASSMARSVSAPVSTPQVTTQVTAQVTATSTSTGDGAAKKIIGTLLGAAAGAAVAYAMVKSEEDSAKKESEFNAFHAAKSLAKQVQDALPQAQAQTNSQQKLSIQDPQAVYETAPNPFHRNISDTDSHYSSPTRSVYAPRAIEAAPSGYHSPSFMSAAPSLVAVGQTVGFPVNSVELNEYTAAANAGVARSRVPSEYLSVAPSRSQKVVEYIPAASVASSQHSQHSRQMMEYVPAASVAPSQSRYTMQRSVTSPDVVSTASKGRSKAPSTLISSFAPEQPEMHRRSSDGSIHSHHSSKSRAKSHVSKHSSTSKHSSKSRSRAPSPTPSASKPGSVIGSILGRDSGSTTSKKDWHHDHLEIEDLSFNDTDTVAPSDSISQVGCSHRSHRSHRSSSGKSSADSSISKHSSSSKHRSSKEREKDRDSSSSHSHHSSSRKSSHSHSSSKEKARKSSHSRGGEEYAQRATVISESSDASTIRPSKTRSSTGSKHSSHSSRKDSVTDDRYDNLFPGNEWGSVATMPIRGISPSMIEETREGKRGKRSVVSFAMGQS